MTWQEYDEKAQQLESEFRDRLPLFDWDVMRAADRATHWRTLGTMDFSDWAIRASVRVNGRKCRAMTTIDAMLMDSANFDYIDFITQGMARSFVQEFMAWRPK